MADSKIQIDLELRKEQAEQRLRNFEDMAREQLEKLQKVQARYNANPNAFHANQLAATRRGYENRLQGVQEAREEVERLQIEVDQNSAKKGGRLFGMAVSESTARFAKQFLGAYVGREVIKLGFAAAYEPGGNNANLRKAEAGVEGAMMGGAAGAMFGPIGLAVGAVSGALIGLTGAIIENQKAIERERVERENSTTFHYAYGGRDMANDSFQKLLGTHTMPAQINMIRERLEQLRSGEGSWSIKSIRANLRRMEDQGDVESENYKWNKQHLERALGEEAQLQKMLMDTSLKTIHKWSDPSSYSDQYAKQGLYSGVDSGREGPLAGIDFDAMNNPVVTELQRIREALKFFADRADNTYRSDWNAEKAASWRLGHFGM